MERGEQRNNWWSQSMLSMFGMLGDLKALQQSEVLRSRGFLFGLYDLPPALVKVFERVSYVEDEGEGVISLPRVGYNDVVEQLLAILPLLYKERT